MNVKKKYNVGDTVWIYGISKNNSKSTQGTILKSFTIENFNNEIHYVIGIPTEIETLLELRTWHTISQTKDGNVGSLRDVFADPSSAHKWLSKIGVSIEPDNNEFTGNDNSMNSTVDDDGPSPDEIHAALERSQKNGEHGPLVTKTAPRKRQYFKKKKL